MASILKVDELQGITAAGDITVTSEGGAATQSLQQGLAKAWANYAHSTGINENLNVSTFTDNGVGDYSLSLVNSFSNANYAVGAAARSGGDRTVVLDSSSTASIVRTNSYVTSSGATVDGDATMSAHGDLA